MTNAWKNLDELDAINAETLLGIPVDQPEYLFSGNLEDLKSEYRHLIKLWHTDINHASNARDVSEHLTKLYGTAKDHLSTGLWQIPGQLLLTGSDGKTYKLSYKHKSAFEFGDLYISRSLVTYVLRPEFKTQFTNALEAIRKLPLANPKVAKEFTEAVPQVQKNFTTQDGRFVLILKKDPEAVRLRDLIEHAGGSLDPKHAAWIETTLHNFACFLSYAKVTHNDIGPDTYFVLPKTHAGALLGGWWYAVPEGSKINGLPERSYDTAPADILREEKADPRIDLGLIRLTGREMLGDPKGLLLHRKAEIPKPLATWLRMPSSGDARADYRAWETNTLLKSFGARRYAELKTTFSEIYEKGEKPWETLHASTCKPMPHPKPS